MRALRYSLKDGSIVAIGHPDHVPEIEGHGVLLVADGDYPKDWGNPDYAFIVDPATKVLKKDTSYVKPPEEGSDAWREVVLASLKKDKIAQIKKEAYDKLKETDWMIIRHVEEEASGDVTTLLGSDFAKLVTERRAIRAMSDGYESVVEELTKNCAEIEEMLSIRARM